MGWPVLQWGVQGVGGTRWDLEADDCVPVSAPGLLRFLELGWPLRLSNLSFCIDAMGS